MILCEVLVCQKKNKFKNQITYLNHTILWTRCNNIIIVWTPRYVQYWTFVTTDHRMIWIDTTDLKQRNEIRNI